MTALVRAIEYEGKKFKRNWKWYILGAFLFGVLPYLNYQFIDGVYYNQVLQWQEGINPTALRTDKDQYCPGEILRIETAFCKTRETLDIERSMYISNGALIQIDIPENVPELPIGCYPEEGVVIATLHEIPLNTAPGFHFTLGRAQYTIEGNRLRNQSWRTIPYMVKPEDECSVE